MLVTYRPELENPPREGAFGVFLSDGSTIRLNPGVNQDINPEVWKQIEELDVVQKLRKIEAIQVINEPEGDTIQSVVQGVEELLTLKIEDASLVAETCHEESLLKEWHEKEKRVRLKSIIARRIEALRTGNY